jgi:hypothetical protein
MKAEINLKDLGDYGLMFAELLIALKAHDHPAIGASAERLAQIARQKHLESMAGHSGVVKS